MKRPIYDRYDRILLIWQRSGVIKTTKGAVLELNIAFLNLVKEIRKSIQKWNH